MLGLTFSKCEEEEDVAERLLNLEFYISLLSYETYLESLRERPLLVVDDLPVTRPLYHLGIKVFACEHSLACNRIR